MIEPATVIGPIVRPIFDQILKAGGAAAQDIKDAYKKVDATNKRLAAEQRYEQRYWQRHGQIKIMPGLMKEPVPLDSIYTIGLINLPAVVMGFSLDAPVYLKRRARDRLATGISNSLYTFSYFGRLEITRWDFSWR